MIKPDYLTFDSLLQKRLFRVPEYQRAYSWGLQQRNDLFFDITKLQTNKKEEVGVDEYGVFSIVDGQQRLTTLIIILKAFNLAPGHPSLGILDEIKTPCVHG